MPEKKTRELAAKRKTPSTQAGEYVREEIEHVREGKHGARSAKQAIAIGLSKARRAGVKLPPPPGKKKAPKATSRKPSPNRSRATLEALKREGRPPRRSRDTRAAAHAREVLPPWRVLPVRPQAPEGAIGSRPRRRRKREIVWQAVRYNSLRAPADVAKLADALDLGSSPRKRVSVQVRPSAPTTYREFRKAGCGGFLG
jgi:Family of unknown function (DUF6496)